MSKENELKDVRCVKCKKLLCRAKGEVEVKCSRCSSYNYFSIPS